MYQIQSSTRWTLPAVKFPGAFESLLDITSIFEFNFVRFLPLSCIRPFSYYDELVVTTLSPMILAFLITVGGKIASFFAKTDEQRKKVKINTFGYILFLMYVVFPSVSTCVLRYFGCVVFEGVNEDGSTQNSKVLFYPCGTRPE